MADLAKLVAEKNQQRAAMKKEYFKLLTNPNAGGGHVFDPAVQRHGSMRVTRIEHFRETPKNFLGMLLFVALPLAGTVYLIKSRRKLEMIWWRASTFAVTQSDRMHMSWSELLMAFDAGAVSAWTRMEGTSKTFYEETPENT
ncbi:hypothetical protein GE061_012061 [Apolygus lucorum]|uniref:NADH dehydrogenase [ubiquinone] 1 beta subcomplex subunit 4 n=1 Tax=Apolygus lucorum TaxID=248454 RepID=A0A8S9XTI6_APOLU|nr:hypothetical protein GE061_012061 [Apolygus lucorum]